MRRIIVNTFLTMDGVMQAPGGPNEDRLGEFGFGGWLPPLFDKTVSAFMAEVFAGPFDLLLGRRTYDIFPAH